jgi:hypothetical protein
MDRSGRVEHWDLGSPTKGELYQSIDMDEAEKMISRTTGIFDHTSCERIAHAEADKALYRAAIERVKRQRAAAKKQVNRKQNLLGG